MAEELVELTAAIQHELELARSGDGYEESAVAGEIVERMVAPMLAARDASFDQRLSDVQEEYRKSLESWDRSRKRLDATVEELRTGWRQADQQHARDVELLLWLHAEAAWQREQDTTRLRARIHEAVDETQRRYGKHQSRCDHFDTWAKWSREHAERMGDKFWQLTSEVHRLYVMSLHEEIHRLRREVEFEAHGTNPSRGDSMALEELETDFHDRAQRRAESGGDSPQCDGDCDNSDCHMTSAVAAWQMAGAAVRRRINELDAGSVSSQCAVHPEGGAA